MEFVWYFIGIVTGASSGYAYGFWRGLRIKHLTVNTPHATIHTGAASYPRATTTTGGRR